MSVFFKLVGMPAGNNACWIVSDSRDSQQGHCALLTSCIRHHELRRSWQPSRNFVFNLRPSRRDEGHVLSKYYGKPETFLLDPIAHIVLSGGSSRSIKIPILLANHIPISIKCDYHCATLGQGHGNNNSSDSRGRPVSSRTPSLERSRIRLRRTDLCGWPPGRLAKFLRGLVVLRKSP